MKRLGLLCLLILFVALIVKFPFFLQAEEGAETPPLSPSSSVAPLFTGRDTLTDTSYQKFLDGEHPFLDLNYTPSDLAPIESDFTANDARKFQLRKEVGIKFADLARHFRNHFKGKKRLRITSAYRSFTHQQQLLSSYCKKNINVQTQEVANIKRDLQWILGRTEVGLIKPA